MKLGIDPKIDYAFKKAFGREEVAPLLIHLLQAVLSLKKPITGLDIVLPETDKDYPADKQVVGDVKARDQGGRQFHLEMQLRVPWEFPKRILYYWGRYHAQQLREGEVYETLRPTYSICFVDGVVFPTLPGHQHVFAVREQTHGTVFSDDLEVHLIELPKFTKGVEELETALDRWCYFLRHGAELDVDRLPKTLDVPEIRQVMEVLTVFTKEEREREAYEQRVKFERDQKSLFIDAEARGSLAGQVQLLQEILKQPRTSLADLTRLSRQELTDLLNQLRSQVLPNGSTNGT